VRWRERDKPASIRPSARSLRRGHRSRRAYLRPGCI
jgi:hypothetical protein